VKYQDLFPDTYTGI